MIGSRAGARGPRPGARRRRGRRPRPAAGRRPGLGRLHDRHRHTGAREGVGPGAVVVALTRTWTSRVVNSTSPQSGQLARMVAIRDPLSVPQVASAGRAVGLSGGGRWAIGPYAVENRAQVRHALPSLRPPHRLRPPGATAHAPENTIEAFRLALAAGCHRAGERRLAHGATARRCSTTTAWSAGCPRRPIGDTSAAGPARARPTLAELYEACGTDFELSPRREGPGGGRGPWSTSPAPRAATPSAGSGSATPTGELRGRVAGAVPTRSGSSTRPACAASRRAPSAGRPSSRPTGIDAVNLHHTDWTGGLTTLFHRFGRSCLRLGRPARPASLDELLDMGIDGVFSDHVDRMMEAVERELPTF